MTDRAHHPTFILVEGLLDYAIVPAGPGDAAGLARVHVTSWRETYGGLLPQAYLDGMRPLAHTRRFYRDLIRAKKGDVVLLAEGAEGAMAYAAGTRLAGDGRAADAEVFTLYVLREAQGAGVGKALLTSAARVLQAEGARSLMLFVLSGNLPARRFYEHLGGEAFAEVPSNGWGGGLTETAYRWPDIGALAGKSAYLS
ncbi:MAG: GNAT family N-acetyltransferase [Caulobacterales bacterium]